MSEATSGNDLPKFNVIEYFNDIQRNRVRDNVELLLSSISVLCGFTLDDPNFAETPSRVAKAYGELLSGYRAKPEDILAKRFPSAEQNDQIIVVKDIKFYSMCAHHMLPFFGKIAVGYLPGKDGEVVGLSKIPRLCEVFARRFQLQERMTWEIADAMNKHLKPNGVGVVVYDSQHLCAAMRGVEEHDMVMQTSAMLGSFRDDSNVKQEFLRLVFGR